jgi:hypothetical protein
MSTFVALRTRAATPKLAAMSNDSARMFFNGRNVTNAVAMVVREKARIDAPVLNAGVHGVAKQV